MKTLPATLSSEALLHFIWRTLRFEVSSLATLSGLPIQVIRPGTWNHDQGPDFLQAKIRIADTIWSGHVELHVGSSEWYQHKHHLDPQYNNVILHVTWMPGTKPIFRQDGTEIPELALRQYVSPKLIHTYEKLHLAGTAIPCAAQFAQVRPFYVNNWVESLAIERVSQKAGDIHARLTSGMYDWDQVIFEELASMMGGPVNREAFRELATRIPFRVLSSLRGNVSQVEALLLGMAGFLEVDEVDTYCTSLSQSWALLKEKHSLEGPVSIPMKFLRMRPASFPTVRLAQLTQLIVSYPTLTLLLQPDQFPDFLTAPISPSKYWETHYRPGHPSKSKSKQLGRSQKEILLINTLLPLSFLYHRAHGREALGELVEQSLSALKAENNRHTRMYEALGFTPENALQSQGLVQLKKKYCDEKRCLECRIGYRILKGSG